MKKIKITLMDSIDQTPISLTRTVSAITPDVLCDILRKRLENGTGEEVGTSFRCEKLEQIDYKTYCFVVHSEDLVACKEVGFINLVGDES